MKSKKHLEKIILFLAAFLAVVYVVNILITHGALSIAQKNLEATKPATLEMTIVSDKSFQNPVLEAFQRSIPKDKAEIRKTSTFDYSSAEGKQLIDRYSIVSVPAIIISGQVDKPIIAYIWDALQLKTEKGVVIIQNIAPYRDLKSDKTHGLVSLVILNDSTCGECYDVNTHKQILQRFGVVLINSTEYDINSASGKDYVSKYNVTKVPTMIMSSDAIAYPDIVQIWKEVGTVESDGQFVFRDVSQMGVYKNLPTGQVVQPQG